MKLLTTIIFNMCLVLGCTAQHNNSKAYHQHITQAQLAFSKNNYQQASELYAKAFTYKPPFGYDMHLAMQIELDYAGGRKEMMKQYMQYCGGKGTELSGEAYLKIMSQVYPNFDTLSYTDELISIYDNTVPINHGMYLFEDQFKTLQTKDQAIRDSAYQVIGYGNNIYTSHMSGRIRQVDQENMEKLVVLMQDTTLNEYNCQECFNNLEIVILHNAAHGNTDWINPLQKTFNDGRMDVRRFVRMIDDAHTRASSVSDLLKEKGLYYGSFNGIRLYNVMFFTTYNSKEKREITQNKKKIGYMTLSEEITIKTWQFLNNDALNFYGFDAFMYSDGTEDEATVASMLQEQETRLQQIRDYQKEHGLGKLIVVKK
jgi:hypothetical protein